MKKTFSMVASLAIFYWFCYSIITNNTLAACGWGMAFLSEVQIYFNYKKGLK